MNLEQRALKAKNLVAKKLFAIMQTKKTNLAVAADVTTKKELLHLAATIGDEICLLKIHIDIIKDFDWDFITQLQTLARQHSFLIVEDRKFCDIGSTVHEQYAGGIFKIVTWADIIIAHAISGEAIVHALYKASQGYERGLLLLAHMSSQENLIDQNYTNNVIKMAQKNNNFVIGCICQKNCLSDPGMLHITPGINLNDKSDNLGQQFNTPEKAIIENGTDIIIVGRGIYKANDPRAAACTYRQAAWHAYQFRLMNYNAASAIGCQPE